jgi:hypothetical protein
MNRSRVVLPLLFVVALFASPIPVAAEPDPQRTDPVQGPPAPDEDPDRPPTLRTARAQTPPEIDGAITESAWQAAGVAEGFTQMRPDPGDPATQRTEIRVLYDDQAIYVGARMYDTAPDSIVAQLGRRDEDSYSDWLYIAFDSYFDRRTAFAFALNPRGVMLDVLLHNDTEEDASWDAVWEGAAQQDAEGWTAEFRIPLSQLRFSPPDPDEEQLWGVNFMRVVARRGEEAFWAPTLPDDGKLVSLFGELRGLEDLEPSRRLEVMPYAVASATAAPGESGDPFHRNVDPFGGVGADIKAGITSDLTLTATVNPDFGQVEADPSVVNLTAFETFFPERRPFFVEGVDIFRFGLGLGDGDLGNESLFYSRRIGRAPQGDVDGDYVDYPDATTILGAAKLSGKTSSGWSIGVLDALTASEYGRFELDGAEGETPIEPLTNYGVARVIKDFRAGRSAVGGIFTATNRSLPESGELDWLRRSAYTGGLDARHRFGNDMYQITGSVVASHITGSAEALDEIQTGSVHYFQRPDADHLEYDPARTSLNGFAARAELFKLQGDWRWALFGMTISPGFEANDMGFQTNADMALTGFWTGYRNDDPGHGFRRWNGNINAWGGTSYGGERISLGGNINGGFQLDNFWGGHLGVNVEAPTVSTSMLRGGPSFQRPASGNIWTSLWTDQRKAVSGELNLNVSRTAETGGRRFSVSPGIQIRPSSNAEVYLGPSFSWNRNPLQYVDEVTVDGSSEWLLGTVEQKTVAMTTRVNYTLSSTLSLQLYAQPFISAGDYTSYRMVAEPRAERYEDRVSEIDPDRMTASVMDDETTWAVDLDGDGADEFDFDDPSFNFKQLRSNLVLRWEYRPGSALFVVWSQGRTDYTPNGRFRFADDVDSLFAAEGTNVLLVKVSYWLGL